MPNKLNGTDVAATTTAVSTMSFPWWWEQLPTIVAPIVALLGISIAIFTLLAKYYEYKANKAKAREMEEADVPIGF